MLNTTGIFTERHRMRIRTCVTATLLAVSFLPFSLLAANRVVSVTPVDQEMDYPFLEELSAVMAPGNPFLKDRALAWLFSLPTLAEDPTSSDFIRKRLDTGEIDPNEMIQYWSFLSESTAPKAKLDDLRQGRPTVRTPAWQVAAFSGSIGIIKMLVERKAKLTMASIDGVSIVDILAMNESTLNEVFPPKRGPCFSQAWALVRERGQQNIQDMLADIHEGSELWNKLKYIEEEQGIEWCPLLLVSPYENEESDPLRIFVEKKMGMRGMLGLGMYMSLLAHRMTLIGFLSPALQEKMSENPYPEIVKLLEANQDLWQ